MLLSTSITAPTAKPAVVIQNKYNKPAKFDADVVKWLCGEQSRRVSMVGLGVDFYLTVYIRDVVAKRWAGVEGYDPINSESIFLPEDTQLLLWLANLQDSLREAIEWQDSFLFTYLCAAVAGELRHVRAHAQSVDQSLVSKLQTFNIQTSSASKMTRADTQKAFLKNISFDHLDDFLAAATSIFNDYSWSNAFGGKKWGLIASTGLSRFRRQLDPTSFVDRVYDLKHNGGPMFDKNKAVDNNYLNQFLSFKLEVSNDTQWTPWIKYCSPLLFKYLIRAYKSGCWKGSDPTTINGGAFNAISATDEYGDEPYKEDEEDDEEESSNEPESTHNPVHNPDTCQMCLNEKAEIENKLKLSSETKEQTLKKVALGNKVVEIKLPEETVCESGKHNIAPVFTMKTSASI